MGTSFQAFLSVQLSRKARKASASVPRQKKLECPFSMYVSHQGSTTDISLPFDIQLKFNMRTKFAVLYGVWHQFSGFQRIFFKEISSRTFSDFFNIHSVAENQKLGAGPFEPIENISKKSHNAEKRLKGSPL